MAVEQTDILAPIGQREPGTILELLSRRFRPELVQQRKIGGRQVSCLPVSAVIERLNRACNTWDFRIVSRDQETMVLNRWNDATRTSEPREVAVSIVVGELEIPEIGTRQAIGVQALDDGSGEDLIKGAASDNLKKCAPCSGSVSRGRPAYAPGLPNRTKATEAASVLARGLWPPLWMSSAHYRHLERVARLAPVTSGPTQAQRPSTV